MRDAVFGYLGLARRAGKLTGGDTACREAMATGDSALIILAADAGDSLVRTFRRLGELHGVPVRTWGDKETLGRAAGTPPRGVLVVRDLGMAGELQRLLEQN